MSYKRKPVYTFSDETSTGINNIPLKRLVLVESFNGTLTIFTLDNVTALTAGSTITDAVNGGNLISATSNNSVKYISSSTNAANGDTIVCDSAGAALGTGTTAYTITLPTGTDGDIVSIMDGSGNSQDRPILVDRNANTIDGTTENLTLDVNYFDIKLVFQSGNWSLGGK